MKRPLLLLLALLAAIALSAEDWPDLIELDAPSLADSAWQDLREGLRAFARPLQLGAQYYQTGEGSRQRCNLLYQIAHASLLVEAQRDSTHLWWSGSLDIVSDRLALRVGSQRLRFGRGIILGNGSRAVSDSLFNSSDPSAPAAYTPLGVSLRLNSGPWRAALFASLQEREARLSGDEVSSLPASRSGLLGSTQESLAGLSAGYQNTYLRAGLLFYWQQYDRDFSSAGLSRELWATSAAAGLQLPANRLDAEFALVSGQPCWLAAWQLQLGPLAQTLSHARNAARLPYALGPSLLDKDSGRSEFNYDLRVILPWHFTASLRYALNSGSLFSGDPLSRLNAGLNYSHAGNSASLAFYSFDRDVVTLAESSYVSPDPRNYRLRLWGSYRPRPRLSQQIDFYYSLADRSDFTQNSYRVRLAFGYDLPRVKLKAGLASWQSPRSFYVPDEDSPDYYSVCSAEDTTLFASASGRFKRLSFSAAGSKSLINEDFSLNLRAGIAVF